LGGARGFVALASSTGPWFLLACLLVAGLVTGGFVLALRRQDRTGLGLAAGGGCSLGAGGPA